MLINNTKKFIFIHIPKAAGTTVTHFFTEYSTCRDIEIGGTKIGELLQPHYRQRYGLSKHSTIDEIDKAIGSDALKDFFIFSFVRNPYHRVISIFKFLRKWKGWAGHDCINNYKDINDFINSDLFSTQGPDRIFNPQSFWIKKGDSKKIEVNYIGKVENIENSLNELMQLFRLPKVIGKVEVKNESRIVSTNQDLNLELSRNSLDLLNLRYAMDFKLFGYEQL
jgi:hypothetical protein